MNGFTTQHEKVVFKGEERKTGARLYALVLSASIISGLAPVWPGALYNLLKYHARLFPEKDIFVVENGSVDTADNMDRSEYLRQHIREVQRARKEGIKVIGYTCWSITSNRGWGLPFGKGGDFGLFHIDLDRDPALRRHPTPAVDTYRESIAQNTSREPSE